MLKYILIIVSCLFFIGCNSDRADKTTPDPINEVEYLALLIYENDAWGAMRTGIIIGADGKAYYYDGSYQETFNVVGEIKGDDALAFNLTQEEFKQSFIESSSYISQVSDTELEYFYQASLKNYDNKEVKVNNSCMDAGNVGYYVIQVNIVNGTHKMILVEQIGDWTVKRVNDDESLIVDQLTVLAIEFAAAPEDVFRFCKN